ncbi:MAG: glycosyltransferase, partial [Anaerolineae bacterium]|nr:glycosyltransferase [Anaerolineae bacterium]
RVLTLPVAVASARFEQDASPEAVAALRERLGLEPQQRVIIWVGYPVAFKRVPMLLEVFKLVAAQEPDARLLLVGDMRKAAEDLGALAGESGIADRVLMPGLVPHADLPAYYALASVYAHTSSYEGLPRVLSEAASAGLPLVGMDCVGVRDLIEDGVNGYLVPDLDRAGMAARLVDLLRSPERAQAMGAQGRQTVLAQYNVADNAARVVESWRRAVELGLRVR